jgi:hypothetical protein
MMPTSKVLSRLAAASAAGVALAAIVFAGPAFAENIVDVSLNSVPSSATAGPHADGFSATLKNNSNQLLAINLVFAIKLTGLAPDQVRIFKLPGGELPRSESGGQIIATDDTPALAAKGFPGSSRTLNYSIQFVTGAPSGRASFTAEAVKGGVVLGSDSRSISVKGAGVATPPRTTGTPTTNVPPGATDPAAINPAAPSGAFPTLQDKGAALGGDSGGIPTGLYVMGVLLVGVGGVILWLLFRQRPQAAEVGYPTSEYDPVPPSLGYPTGRATAPGVPSPDLHPTAPMPTVRAAAVKNPTTGQATPPPVDPWANPGS